LVHWVMTPDLTIMCIQFELMLIATHIFVIVAYNCEGVSLS